MMPLFQMQRCRPKNILQKNSLGDRYSHEKIVIPLLISTSVWNFQFHCTVHFENIITMPLTSTCTSNSDISLSWVMLNTSSVQSNKFQGCALRTIKGSLMLWPCEIQSTYNLGQNWRENCILEKHLILNIVDVPVLPSPPSPESNVVVYSKKSLIPGLL